MLLGLLAPRLLAADGSRVLEKSEHVVAAGETLWELAGEYGEGEDRRRFVFEAMRLNGMHSPSLVPGQRLVLPRVFSH